jgi:hypothetical protein
MEGKRHRLHRPLGASSNRQHFVNLLPAVESELTALVKSIHDYWSQCHVPAVDASGFAAMTDSQGEAGERFPKRQR